MPRPPNVLADPVVARSARAPYLENVKTSQFSTFLDQALNHLKHGLLQEFVKHVDPDDDPQLACTPLAHADKDRVPLSIDVTAAVGNEDPNSCSCQDGFKLVSQSTDTMAHNVLEETQHRTMEENEEDEEDEGDEGNGEFHKITSPKSYSADDLHITPCSNWARFVRLIICLGRGKFSILSCWIPAEDAPKLQFVLASTLIPVGQETQNLDELWQTWRGIAGYSGKPWGHSEPRKKRTHRFILHPSSSVRALWCLCGLFGIIFDAAMISLAVFDLESTQGILIIDWTFRTYWVLDMMVSFRTGFYVKETYVSSPKKIARHYLTTWFTIDAIAIVPDLILTFILTDRQSVVKDYSQTFRYLKAFKMIRLLHVAKVAVWARDFLDSLNSITIIMSVHMIKYLMLIMCWVHFCACAWYGIAKDAEDSWITRHKFEHYKLPQTYFVSLQWAFAQLQGSSDITGSFSASERAFHCVVVMASIFVLAVFISNVTNSLIQLQITWDEKARQLRALQDYLRKHRVSTDVSERVRKYCEQMLKIERKLNFGEDDVTQMLPNTLRRELLVEVRKPMVQQGNPFFIVTGRMLPKSFQRLCCDIISPFFEGPDNTIYNFNDKCSRIYFNVAGQFVYNHVNNQTLMNFMNLISNAANLSVRPSEDVKDSVSSRSRSRSQYQNVAGCAMRDRMNERTEVIQSTTIENAQPICEAAMWTYWTHCGDLTSASHVAGLMFDASLFSHMVESDVMLQDLGIAHAVRWVRVMNVYDITDLVTSNEVLEYLHTAGEAPTESFISIRSTLSNLTQEIGFRSF